MLAVLLADLWCSETNPARKSTQAWLICQLAIGKSDLFPLQALKVIIMMYLKWNGRQWIDFKIKPESPEQILSSALKRYIYSGFNFLF